MQPVENVAQVMQVLRRQMAENLERMRSSGKLADVASATRQASAPRATPTLRQSVARRMKAIDADDPRHLEKATLLFVESVLLAEFGETRVNDPHFRDLVQQVQAAMLADAELESGLSRLAAQLRQSQP